MKKGADAWLSRWRHERRIKTRLRILRKHFEDNPSALQTIEKLTGILSPPLVDLDDFERILNEQLEKYIHTLLGLSGEFNDKYENLYADFSEFHRMAENPERTKDELAQLWRSLDDKYFHRHRMEIPIVVGRPDDV